MLSIIVYGRNDSHGYNLHKRAAISLNAMAEVLTEPDDEIIFVDYNTPDDHPTFIEAIHDTLSERTRALLRVLRFRSTDHAAIAGKHTLRVVEPLARNIALRRSNPANRWVLNTNTDIIIHMRQGTLAGLLQDLPDGFYQAPRVEIPETLWESLDRKDGPGILAATARYAPALHLDDIVYGMDQVLFDGCGDFQLTTREALFAIDAFHEGMDRGWHVDSNMAVRMGIHFGKIHSLEDRLFAYHCDHTRQVSPLHKAGHVGNDPIAFVEEVDTAELPDQRETWGAPQADIGECRIDGSATATYLASLTGAIGAPQDQPLISAYRPDSYGVTDYDPRHVLPFLLDMVQSGRRTMKIGWCGHKGELLAMFAAALEKAGFVEPIRTLANPLRQAMVQPTAQDEWLAESDLFIFDFGDPAPGRKLTKAQLLKMAEALGTLRKVEAQRAAQGHDLRRIAGISTVHNRYEKPFGSAVHVVLTPFSTRIRSGFARPISDVIDWLMIAAIDADSVTGRSVGIKTGAQALHVELAEDAPRDIALDLALDIDGTTVAQWHGTTGSIGSGGFSLPFQLERPGQQVTVRLRGEGVANGALARLWSAPRGMPYDSQEVHRQMLGKGRNWLPYSRVGRGGERVAEGVRSVPGRRGHVIFGPYWLLPAGRYSGTVDFTGGPTTWSTALREMRAPIFIEVVAGTGSVVQRKYVIPSAKPQSVRFSFQVAGWQMGIPIEIRVFSAGASAFTVTAVNVEALDPE